MFRYLFLLVIISFQIQACKDSSPNKLSIFGNENKTNQPGIITRLSNSKDGNHHSPLFQLSGPAILRYKYEPIKFTTGGFTVYVLPEGTDINTDGGIPEVMAMYAEESEILIEKPNGKYYLLVSAINADWEVVLEEKAK